ncbi:MAG TPA: FAD:protein FMN transferase [Pseudolabrys sp.]|nr:FAD:protein FMN transferase [Pseudolabrys sp.]
MPDLFTFPFMAMASDCRVSLCGDHRSQVEQVAQSAVNEVARIERRYSRYLADSVVSEINTAGQRAASILVDEETAKLLDFAFACYRRSDGLFDISSGILRRVWDFKSSQLPSHKDVDQLLPLIGLSKISWERPRLKFSVAGMELDFGGIGKEYAADQAAAVCRALGVHNGLVDLGGDTVIIGPHPKNKSWTIGIRHPRDPDSTMASVTLDNGALASSGDYERYMMINGKRYCHILNPFTGWPCFGLAAVSIVAEQCLLAGAIATTAMLKGRDARDWLSRTGLKFFCVDESGRSDSNF